MDDYAEQYGWNNLLSPRLIARNRYTEDGETIGQEYSGRLVDRGDRGLLLQQADFRGQRG